MGGDVAWASGSHYLASGAWVTLALLPFCTTMGATFPLAMTALRHLPRERSERTFSYLYVANVIGATSGTLVSAFLLIELFGFRGTGLLAAALNGALAIAALALSRSQPAGQPIVAAARQPAPSTLAAAVAATVIPDRAVPWMLFSTGLISLAMEVVWVRQFTPFLGTVVYAFALILAVYLGATFLGSMAYRRWARRRSAPDGAGALTWVWLAAFLFSLLPLLFADPRPTAARHLVLSLGRLFFGIVPFCAAVGFLTPMLVDRWSAGDPDRAGRVYAINILGCILGPLVAGFLLLPTLGERWSLVVLALPLLAISFVLARRIGSELDRRRPFFLRPGPALAAAGALALLLIFVTRDFETIFERRALRRDYSATVLATGAGMEKRLFINGEGITTLTPITKMMAHLPLAFLATPPQDVLVICFGMGTSFRSTLSWGIPCTAVELIPSVPALFGYFHADAANVRAIPGARIVVDDGRRFLERSTQRFAVVTVDPPPPVEAAGSSLLYSRQFYEVVKEHLVPGGILQQWLPGEDPTIVASAAKALAESFPHVRAFRSMQGWGFHFIASLDPIPDRTPAELAARLPAAAAADLVEWEPATRPADAFAAVLAKEVPLAEMIGQVPGTPAIEDNRPINEYYFVRWLVGKVARRMKQLGSTAAAS
jgi:predicted membrane-bound spermidine synthase